MVVGSVGLRVTSSGKLLTQMRRWKHDGPVKMGEEFAIGLVDYAV